MIQCHLCARTKTGFTLLEVIVAITISAIVVLTARVVVEQIETSAIAVRKFQVDRSRTTLADWTLRSLVGQIDVSDAATATFVGTDRYISFTTWCLNPAGWEEVCRARLRIIASPGGAVLTADAGALSNLQLDTFAGSAQFRYLLDASNGGHWLTRWAAGPTTPLAIGIVGVGDTLVLRIGSRG